MGYLVLFLTQLLLFSSVMLYVSKGRDYPWKFNITCVASIGYAVLTTGLYFVMMLVAEMVGIVV